MIYVSFFGLSDFGGLPIFAQRITQTFKTGADDRNRETHGMRIYCLPFGRYYFQHERHIDVDFFFPSINMFTIITKMNKSK